MTIWCTNTFSVDGVDLAWGEVGSGPPFVLVHGYTGSAHDFATHVDALGKHSHVFATDHRGHGHSTNTGDPASYSVERLVDDLEAWADAVVGEPFDLLGHSMGGRIALMLTLRRPDLVKSLILMDTTAWAMVADGSDLADQLRALTDEQLLGYIVTSAQDPESVLIREIAPPSWTEDNQPNKLGVDVVAARALGLEIFEGDPGVGERLGEITCPTTIIVGELDHPFVDRAQPMADGISGSTLVVIPGAWHSPQLTHPAEWLAAVEDHLERARAS